MCGHVLFVSVCVLVPPHKRQVPPNDRWIVQILQQQRGFCWQHFCFIPDNGAIVPCEEVFL